MVHLVLRPHGGSRSRPGSLCQPVLGIDHAIYSPFQNHVEHIGVASADALGHHLNWHAVALYQCRGTFCRIKLVPHVHELPDHLDTV